VPRLDEPRRAQLDPIEGQPPDLVRLPPGCRFRPRCRYAVARCAVDEPPLAAAPAGTGPAHVTACWVADTLGAPAHAPAPA
jgi:oligopeptide/dipeptide ABC transporter ATP-binding protein